MNWARSTLFLTVAEVQRLARTEQVFRYFLIPALVLFPVALLVVVLILSFEGEKGRVAIPAGELGGLPLRSSLEAEDLDVLVTHDPRAAWERREVDAAIVSVTAGDGIGERGDPEHATREAWLVELVSDDRGVSERVETAVESGADEVFDAIVALSGGQPGAVRVASVTILSFEGNDASGFDAGRGARAYILMVMGAISMIFLTLPMVADRREGLTETMRALPVPITATLWSRALAMTGLQLVGTSLLAGNLLLLLPLLQPGAVPPPLVVEVPGFAAALLATNAMFVAVGVVADSAKAANNVSSLVMLVQIGALLLGVFGEPWSLVPIAGVIAADSAPARAGGVLGCVLFTFAVLFACGRLLHNHVRFVLPRGTE